ncbi:MAG TPA: Ig-like domain-containing protein [Verrucomicrobiae bacterium]|nr:Ig-like domain-containing protein [Verrucomicrobiae bacterium]
MKTVLASFVQIFVFSSFCAGQSPAPAVRVRILNPTNGTVLRAHQQSVIQVEVTALDGLVSKVDVFVDTNSLGHLAEPPFTFPFQADALGSGVHHLSVTASDNRGDQATSPSIEVTVLAFAPVVRAVYLIPADRTLNPAYVNAIFGALTNLQGWYSQQLSNGTAFRLNVPAVESYVTPHAAIWYATNAGGYFYNALNDGFVLTGGTYPDPDITWVFYLDADAKGQATGGIKGVAVLHQGDLQGLVAESSSTTKRWIGGSGHELGHAFGLLHPPSCETPIPGVVCASSALMWLGYTTYPDTYLLPADKSILNQSGFFYAPTNVISLLSPQIGTNGFSFNANVETGWPYRALSSSNLQIWDNYTNFVTQSSNVQIHATISSTNKLFRVQYK